MKTKLQEFLKQQSQGVNNSVRGTIMAMVGGYVIYLAVQMLLTMAHGETTMSPALTIILAALLCIGGILVFALGAYIFYIGWQREKGAFSEPNEDPSQE